MHRKSNVHRFIDEARAKGASEQEIQHQLLDAGWHMDIIQHAMKEHASVATPPTNSTSLPGNWRNLFKKPLFYAGVFLLLLLIASFI